MALLAENGSRVRLISQGFHQETCIKFAGRQSVRRSHPHTAPRFASAQPASAKPSLRKVALAIFGEVSIMIGATIRKFDNLQFWHSPRDLLGRDDAHVRVGQL